MAEEPMFDTRIVASPAGTVPSSFTSSPPPSARLTELPPWRSSTWALVGVPPKTWITVHVRVAR
jgi:hypothetical protein